MAATLASLGLDRLPLEDRLARAHELWDSIFSERPSQVVLTAARRDELRRRAAEADADPDGGIPWEDVKARTREACGK